VPALCDVNVLLALVANRHSLHGLSARWSESVPVRERSRGRSGVVPLVPDGAAAVAQQSGGDGRRRVGHCGLLGTLNRVSRSWEGEAPAKPHLSPWIWTPASARREPRPPRITQGYLAPPPGGRAVSVCAGRASRSRCGVRTVHHGTSFQSPSMDGCLLGRLRARCGTHARDARPRIPRLSGVGVRDPRTKSG
jgi:hypothetical protein